MFTLCVVKDGHGWGIDLEPPMTMHFRCQEAAIREAHLLAAAMRRHGVPVAVNLDGTLPIWDPSSHTQRDDGPVPETANGGAAGSQGHW